MPRLFNVIGMIGLCLTAHDSALSQSRDSTSAKSRPSAVLQAATPACCSIVRIDALRSIVTARETATGFTFRFAVRTRQLLGTLKIGQPVWADFAGKTVRLKATDAQPCCAIVDTQETP
jgi:hypothetical protein